MFDYDATGIEPSKGQGKVLPRGWYSYEVITYTTNDGSKTYPMEGYTQKNKYPKVDLLVQVIDDPADEDMKVFHTVTFMPKDAEGSGMAIHFLKTINQPWEGKIKPDCDQWVGEKFDAYTLIDEYNGKKKNKLSEIAPYGSKVAKTLANSLPKASAQSSDSDVPF